MAGSQTRADDQNPPFQQAVQTAHRTLIEQYRSGLDVSRGVPALCSDAPDDCPPTTGTETAVAGLFS